MSHYDELNKVIVSKQADLDAVQKAMDGHRQNGKPELAEGMQSQANSIASEISEMQGRLPEAQAKDVKEAEDAAAAEQKKKDRGIGMSDLFG